MMQGHNISEWLHSDEYRRQITATLARITRETELSESEAETADIFERNIYFLVKEQAKIDLHFRKEAKVEGIVHQFCGLSARQSGRGRIDAIVNNLIIEYKHHSKLYSEGQIASAYAQVQDYLLALSALHEEKYDAILTDGLRIAYFSLADKGVRHTVLRPLRVDDIDRIIQACLNNKTKKFAPANIVKDFSISPRTDSPTRHIAIILFRQLQKSMTGKSQMLYAEWKELMHLSVEDNGKSGDIEKRRNDLSGIFNCSIDDTEKEYKALFALQTVYSIIVKLLACKVVDSLNYHAETYGYHDLASLPSEKTRAFFQRMEDGYSYNNMGIRNFLEGDFFSWYADKGQWSEDFWQSIRQVITTIDDYSAFSLNVRYEPIDVFKDLYMSIIPQSIRHSMGEYFTPEWLADCVITEALSSVDNPGWKAIDPCCGSGIFLIALIKKIVGEISVNDLSEEEKKRILNAVLTRVQGIDINPLSVLSARVSYYIAIHPFGEIHDVELPVYLGDSAIVPRTHQIDGVLCYTYSIRNSKFFPLEIAFPVRFVKRSDFGRVMNDLQALVRTENADLLYQALYGQLTEEERKASNLLKSIRSMCDNLVWLHQNKWDGIWIRIATNFMQIARLQRFDLIVGNPPWVKWEHLPAEYTRRIKEFCDIRHIFCNDGGMYGGAQLNICALIANVAASNWLKEDGMLAFLMPDSLMSQNSYEEFRRFYTDYDAGKRLYLQKIDRWCPPLRPFRVGRKAVTQDFNTYYYASPEKDYRKGIPVRNISKKKGVNDLTINRLRTYREALDFLEISEGCVRQLSQDSTAFTYVSAGYDFSMLVGPTAYFYRTGVESTPFEIFKMTGMGPSTREGHYRFRNKTLKTSKYKVDDIPVAGWDFPTRLIYPMVEGPSVSPFSFDAGNNFHIIPYEQTDTSRPIPLEKMYEQDRNLALYFVNHKHIIDMQSEKSKAMHRGSEFYALSKIGPYTFAPHLVAARDNSSFCASGINLEFRIYRIIRTFRSFLYFTSNY